MNNTDWKQIADAMAADFSNPVFEGKGYKAYDSKGSSIDFMDGNPGNYLLEKAGENAEAELEEAADELYSWTSLGELKNFMPSDAQFMNESVLDYIITGFTGSSMHFSVCRMYGHWYLVCGGDGSVDDIYRITFEEEPCHITDFVFDRFVTDPDAGKVVPMCDLEPIRLNERFVERKQFQTLLKSFMTEVFKSRRGIASFMDIATEAFDGVLAEKLLPFLPEELHPTVIRFKEDPDALDSGDRQVQIQMGRIWIAVLTAEPEKKS